MDKDKMKNFWAAHKTKILVSALVVTTTVVVIQRIGLKQHNEFLKENNLFEKYYYLNEM